MIPETPPRMPDTFGDFDAAINALGDLANAFGFPTTSSDEHLTIHTSNETFLCIERAGSGYYWGNFKNHTQIAPGHIASPMGMAGLTLLLVKNSLLNTRR